MSLDCLGTSGKCKIASLDELIWISKDCDVTKGTNNLPRLMPTPNARCSLLLSDTIKFLLSALLPPNRGLHSLFSRSVEVCML